VRTRYNPQNGMSHPIVLALYDDPPRAAAAARGLRDLGVARERVSIVARTHDEEGWLASATGASPGSEIEDSRPASRLGELSAHFLAAIAVVLPGVGPIVADGPLAAGLGEAAGHLAGGVARALEGAGLPAGDAEAWERDVEQGGILVAAHADDEAAAQAARARLEAHGPKRTAQGLWPDP
jgi:hypothetical protein